MRGSSVANGGDIVPSPITSFANICSSNNAGTLTMFSRVSTAPHGVEIPTILAYRCLDEVRT